MQDEEFVKNSIPAEDLLGMIHYNLEIMDADRQGRSPYDFSPKAIDEILKIKEVLDRD
jgi:CO dehydrogenase maturation factor